jgi:hypothetical protein
LSAIPLRYLLIDSVNRVGARTSLGSLLSPAKAHRILHDKEPSCRAQDARFTVMGSRVKSMFSNGLGCTRRQYVYRCHQPGLQ